MSDIKKRGLVKITNGKYTDKDGREKNRYVTVGEYFATDGGHRQAIKLYATAFSDEKWLNIYIEEDGKFDNDIKVIEEIGKAKENVLEDIDDKPINLSEIPF